VTLSVIHLQGRAKCLPVMFVAQSGLKAVQDQSGSDVAAGVVGGTQLYRGRLDLWGVRISTDLIK